LKKVLLCTNVFNNVKNGPGRFANLFYHSNTSQDYFEPFVLTEDCDDSQQSERLIKLNMSEKTRTHLFSQVFRNFYYYKQVKKIQEEYNIDAILFNNAATGILTARNLKKKCFGFVNDNENIDAKFFPIKLKRHYIRRAYLKILEKIATKSFTKIITNSNYLTQLVRDAYSLKPEKVQRLYKAVNIEYLSQYRWDNPYKDGRIIITFVKNDYVRGGLWDLFDSLKILEHQQFELNVVGPNDNAKDTILKRCVAENVKLNFLGSKKQEEIIQLLLKSHIFSTPARGEALGVANIEALAIGIPVISTEVGGIPEVLDNGNNGYLVASQSPEALAKEIEECIFDKAFAKVKNGLEFSKNFSKQELFKNINDIVNA
jgi:glycosyltransferase involved in cell wall biosynthesis